MSLPERTESYISRSSKHIKTGNAYFFGFSKWKQGYTKLFLQELKNKNIFFHSLAENSTDSFLSELTSLDEVYIWGKKSFNEVERYAEKYKIKVYRVEDGFIRSIGLGSNLTQPYSLVIDSRGIYFDPSEESDLEYILKTYDFKSNTMLLDRAEAIRDSLIKNKISKYNTYENISLNVPKNRYIIVIPGQVDDDASIRFGATGMTNLELIKQVREKNQKAYIIFKPHPDVLAGNRKGAIDMNTVLEYCDSFVTEVSIDSVLKYADEVHTMTSLVGFEALLRGIKVFTYGVPFYAGWGLTHDTCSCKTRTRMLSINELVAAALILYPRYINPKTDAPCEVEVLIDALLSERNKSKFYNLHRLKNFLIMKFFKN